MTPNLSTISRALIDANYLIYHAAWESRDMPVECESVLRRKLSELLTEVKSFAWNVVLVADSKEKSNHPSRKDIYTLASYKGTRVDAPEIAAVKEQLRKVLHQWCVSVPGLEADDIIMHHANPSSIIVSADKDLNTIEGWHFNPVKRELYYIEFETAIWFFWYLVLVGDSSDNIKGARGIGDKTARKLLEKCKSEGDYISIVSGVYKEVYGEQGPNYLDQTMAVLSPWGLHDPYEIVEHNVDDLLAKL